MTADSVKVGDYYRGSHGITLERPDPYSHSFAVYGQVAVVTKSSSRRLRPTHRVVLVWWTYGPGCEREFPPKAIVLPVQSEVFIARPVRPVTEWINGLPTVDADFRYFGTNYIWAPAVEDTVLRYFGRTSVKVSLMSAREYFEMYEHFTEPNFGPKDFKNKAQRFLEWADSRKPLRRKYPLCEIASFALMNLYQQMDRMPDDCEQ